MPEEPRLCTDYSEVSGNRQQLTADIPNDLNEFAKITI
jgi:hypothetical protein